MANVSDSHSDVKCLKALEGEIVKLLESSDLGALSTEADELGVISSDVKRTFDTLDPNVPRPRKIRYLLIHAYEQLESNPRQLERWLKVLSRHGVSSAVLCGMGPVGTTNVGLKCSQSLAKFSEEHVTALVDLLASCSGKWRNICMSLNLPRSIERTLRRDSTCMMTWCA